jgi:hypothetical protein
VLLPTAIFYRSMKLVRWLYDSEDWKCAFCDGSSMLFVRSDNVSVSAVNLFSPCVVDSIRQSLRTRWSQNTGIYDEASYHLSNLLRFLEIENEACCKHPGVGVSRLERSRDSIPIRVNRFGSIDR